MGGPGGPPGMGGRGGFGPGMFLAQMLMTALDKDKNNSLTAAEFTEGFLKWFDTWDAAHSGVLTEEQLRNGISQAIQPFRGGPPPGGGFGPPGGPEMP